MISLTENILFYFVCAFIALSVRVVLNVCATLAKSKFLSGLNRRLRRFRAFGMGGRRKHMLPLYHTRQPWESLCSSHALDYPRSTDPIVFVEPEYEHMEMISVHEQEVEEHRFFVGGFEIIIDRPYKNSVDTYSTQENTVHITKLSTEEGTGNSVTVFNAESCAVKNCNTVHVHKRYVNVHLDCEKCLGVQVKESMQCESCKATHMSIEKCPDVQEIAGWHAVIDTTIKPGCYESIVYAAKPAFPRHYKEKFDVYGMRLEYNHLTQELNVFCDCMAVKVCNVDSVQLEDVSKCKVKHCNVVKGYPTTYNSLENWSDRMENCQKVIFLSTMSDNLRWTTKIIQEESKEKTFHYVKF